jgi:hypothetical protein
LRLGYQDNAPATSRRKKSPGKATNFLDLLVAAASGNYLFASGKLPA